jgi:nucleolar protein 12
MSDANYRPGDLAAYLSKNAKTKHRIVDEESRKNEKKGSKRRKKNNDDDAIEESTKLINLFDKHRDRQPSIPQGISSINTIKKERTAENDNLTLTKSKKRQKLDVSRQSTIDTTDQKRSKKTNMDSAEVCERTVFVGNVPLETKKRAIHKLFAVFGPIDSIRLRSVVCICIILRLYSKEGAGNVYLQHLAAWQIGLLTKEIGSVTGWNCIPYLKITGFIQIMIRAIFIGIKR